MTSNETFTIGNGGLPIENMSLVFSCNPGVSNAMYINGSSATLLNDDKDGGTGSFTSPDVNIGAMFTSQQYLGGAVQEVAVAHRVWTQDDVDLYHNGGQALTYS